MTSPALTTPAITGTATGTGVATAATASTLALRDAQGAITGTNFIEGFTTTATAAGTTTMTVSSTYTQVWTGSLAQTVKLPTTTVAQGQQYEIINQSTGLVTVQSSGANTILILAAGTSAIFTAVVATPTTAANWDAQYISVKAASGKVGTFSNTLTLAGTDGTTITFPSTSATMARTDAANTFTGIQTFSTPIAATSVATMTATVGGGVPTPPNNTTTFLRGDGTFATPAAGGSKFGGTGADGALSISSGTTTLDAANAAVFIKNYSSIAITGTAVLAFINPNANGTVVMLKSQGAVTITSATVPCIEVSNMGAPAPAAQNGVGVNTLGTAGANGYGFSTLYNKGGFPGTTAGANGAAGTPLTDTTFVPLHATAGKYPWVVPASSGANGSVAGGTGTYNCGQGGNGGGALIIECGGALNFTGTINANGGNGTAGFKTTGNTIAGGGGGGGGGVILILYATLTANTGTMNVTAGTTGLSSSGSGYASGAGTGIRSGNGYTFVGANTEYA